MFDKIKNEMDIAYYCLMIGIAMLIGGVLQFIVLIPTTFILGDLVLDPSISMLLSLYTTILTSLVIFYIALKKAGFTLESLGLTKKNVLGRYVFGLFIGFMTLSLSLLITYVLGGAKGLLFVGASIGGYELGEKIAKTIIENSKNTDSNN